MGLDMFIVSRRSGTTEELNEVAYFRKFNAFLAWLETNIGATENCGLLPLTRDHFVHLQTSLAMLTQSNCSELFPVTTGFFFGSQEYDEYYWECVENLKLIVNDLLLKADFQANDYYFYAWY